jgi:hypothetical protein
MIAIGKLVLLAGPVEEPNPAHSSDRLRRRDSRGPFSHSPRSRKEALPRLNFLAAARDLIT